MNPEDTEPNLASRLKSGTKKADPWFDRVLSRAVQSEWTPWIVVGVLIAAILFGVWVSL